MKTAGFTILELLTVIAIIGILAAVILPRLQNARDEGINAKIIAELNGLSRRAAVEESQVRHYNFVCGSGGYSTSTQIMTILDSIATLSPGVVCNSSNGEYAVSATLTGGSSYACVDRAGEVSESSTLLTAGVYTCP